MSRKKIGQIKEGKWFRIGDLIVYGVIAALLVALFLALFFTRDNSATDGIRLCYRGESVFEYDYHSDKYEIKKPENIVIESDTEEKLQLTFYTYGRSGYNKVVIDKNAKSVRVTEADCSIRRDCVYTPAITDNSSVICCTPHALSVEPLLRKINDDGDIVIG
ncbi:MAG: NusG domain II-containing protein [Clostridia bacterium]|nr:NusG domain II-containing protein [Clostridia bacterium]